MRKRIDMYADRALLAHLKRQFSYCFATPEGSEYPPIITGHEIEEPFAPFEIRGHGGSVPVLAFWQGHGGIRSLGYRLGPIAYSSDVSDLDADAFAALEGVKLWIVDALRYREHPTHANVDTALAWIAKVKPERAILTNLHHDLDYEQLRAQLPHGVEPAYDGLTVEVPFST
jgi:phosphoribosyl 1,2-cyclic phosphate phosphodiesterase